MSELDKENLPQHIAIIMDPPSQRGFLQTAYHARNRYAQALQADSAVSKTGCFGGREFYFGGFCG